MHHHRAQQVLWKACATLSTACRSAHVIYHAISPRHPLHLRMYTAATAVLFLPLLNLVLNPGACFLLPLPHPSHCLIMLPRSNLTSLPVWHLMGDYLSARLIKTAELDPQGRYLFAAYPHGISAISGWTCFATEAAGFSKLFPGA